MVAPRRRLGIEAATLEIGRAEDIAPALEGAQGPLRVANLET